MLPVRQSGSKVSSKDQSTHSSPFKNSAVRNKCSRDRVADKTPPYSSVSLTVLSADPDSVDYIISPSSSSRFWTFHNDPP